MQSRRNSLVHFRLLRRHAWLVALLLVAGVLRAKDWPMFGRDRTRNAVSPEKNPPTDWDVKTGQNIKWKAQLGSQCYSTPVIANGLVWIGSNNGNPRDKSFTQPAGVLMCFRESDGTFLYQHVSPKRDDATRWWAEFGYTCSPTSQRDRLWVNTTSAETICLDISALPKSQVKPKEIWKVSLMDELGVFPRVGGMGGGKICSIPAPYGDLIYVITSNGVALDNWRVVAPNAPALVCFNKKTGKVVWQDNSSGTNIIFGEWGSPLVMEIKGRAQVIAPQGDGWIRSFDARTGQLIWKFDINPKKSKRGSAWMSDANYFLSAPVFFENKIYIAAGQSVDSGEGSGRLCCIDPTKQEDISLELEDGPGKGKPNPNSGAVWHFDEIGRTISTVAALNGLVIAPDFSGFVYCLDARTGQKYWKHDMRAHVCGSPLIVDGKVYVGEEDGNVFIFALGKEKKVIAQRQFEGPVYASPIYANGVLYIAAQDMLYAIQQE